MSSNVWTTARVVDALALTFGQQVAPLAPDDPLPAIGNLFSGGFGGAGRVEVRAAAEGENGGLGGRAAGAREQRERWRE